MKRFTLGSGLVGLCALIVAPLAAPGCSSGTMVVGGASGGSNGNGSGGSNGSSSGGSNGSSSGGSNGSSSGGSNGSSSGGSNGSSSGGSDGSGSGGSNGSGSGGTNGGGGGTGTGCTAKPASDLIADFTADGQVGPAYKGADMGLTVPTVTTDGSLVITIDTGMPSTMYPYAYVGLGFKSCFDASEYKGVTFKASGMLSTGCTIQYSTVDKEHNKPPEGTCMATACYASSKVFDLASSPTDVTVNFADQIGGGADPSALVVDPTQVTSVQWQVNPDPMSGCKGTVTIDDIKFVK